jgi:trehalose 6-phosphate synthase/phosphatase
VSDTVLSGLYRAADVLLVTPLRDGMNLVAKEFVASRTDTDGVLVLSEFAGAADELTSAMIVNPYDVDGMADAIHMALTMPRDERRERMQKLRDHVMQNDVASWAASFLDRLGVNP